MKWMLLFSNLGKEQHRGNYRIFLPEPISLDEDALRCTKALELVT